MKIMRMIAPCLIAAGLVVGCDATTPTEQPPEAINSPSFAADQNWIHDAFYQDAWLYIDCLGEDVHFYGPVPYQWHRVTSASGNYNYNYQIRPLTPNLPPFYAETASGVVYLYKNGGPINQTYHAGPGEVLTNTDKETYVAENGDKLKGVFQYHVTVNANGVLTVEKITPMSWVCIDK